MSEKSVWKSEEWLAFIRFRVNLAAYMGDVSGKAPREKNAQGDLALTP